jgi:hypothetical protein
MSQAIAFSELARVSKSDQQRRAVIYSDIDFDNKGSAWKRISEECMKVIDEVKNTVVAEYQRVDIIGKYLNLSANAIL